MEPREWTVDTLKAHLERLLDEADKRNQQRFDAQKEAINTAMTASEKAIGAAMAAAKEAVLKAEAANERRFELLNEFRGALRDQTASFIPRAEANVRIETIEDKLAAAEKRLDTQAGRSSGVGSTWAVIAAVAALLLAAIAAVASFL